LFFDGNGVLNGITSAFNGQNRVSIGPKQTVDTLGIDIWNTTALPLTDAENRPISSGLTGAA
jgi:hypothetical protein